MSTVIEDVTFEQMLTEHLPTVWEIEKRSFTLPWHHTSFANELTNSSAFYFVAKRSGSVVGYGGMWLLIDEAHITTIAVDPVYRGRRIGEQILLELIDVAINKGMRQATLEVRESNLAAQNLYKKYGFKAVAVRRRYYPDNKENAVVMWTEDMRFPEFQSMLAKHRAELAK